MIASGERMDFSTLSRPDRRQALHRRRRRQDHAAAGAAGRGVRRRGAAAVRPRPRPHRRHPRQAGVDPGLAGDAVATRRCSPSSRRRRGDLRGRRRAGAGGQEALRAARRHRHRRGDPADRLARSCSKKIAEGTGSLVLDVKVGTGAFMKDLDRARELAETMVGARHRRRACAPSRCSPTCPRRSASPPATRSRSRESVEVLAGGGPADVVELTLALAREMLAGAGRRRRRPGRQARRRLGDGRLEGDDPRPRAATPTRRCRRPARRTWSTAPVLGRADPARRDGGRAGRLAARRRPGPQGGDAGAGRRRRRVARPPRRRGHRGRSRCSRCSPTSRSASTAPWPRSRAATTSRRRGHGVRARRRWCIDRIG